HQERSSEKASKLPIARLSQRPNTASSCRQTLLPRKAAELSCHQYTNRSCEECLKNVTCLWCVSSQKCMEYPVRRILPPTDLCELRSARWGVCWGQTRMMREPLESERRGGCGKRRGEQR
uniref:PTTG1 interacting protein n=1 Tax=Apteryx owenii TaxID=8824 RepID=A0A8B9PZ38_APTOW